MTAHTKGPWTSVKPMWTDPHRVRHIIDADRNLIARVDFANAHQSENEALANATLIAAAPCLLKALQNLVADFDESVITTDPMLIEAREAIAKATAP